MSSLAGSTFNVTVDLSPFVTLVTIAAILYIAYRFCKAVKNEFPPCCPRAATPEVDGDEEGDEKEEESDEDECECECECECGCCEECDCDCHDEDDDEGGTGETGDPSPLPA